MAPATRSHGSSRRAAGKSKAAAAKSGGARERPQRDPIQCPDCGKPCSPGAGLASHRRSAHPDPATSPAPVTETTDPAPRDIPIPPEGLSESARRLFRSIVAVYDLRADEIRVLEDACREAMLIDRLDRELESAALMVKGSMGQLVASPLVSEIRQHRSTLAGLMAKLKLPDDPAGEVPTDSAAERSTKARAAANARWRRGS